MFPHTCNYTCYDKKGNKICGDEPTPIPASTKKETMDFAKVHSWGLDQVCIRCGHSKDYAKENGITVCPRGNDIVTAAQLVLMDEIKSAATSFNLYLKELRGRQERLDEACSQIEVYKSEMDKINEKLVSISTELLAVKNSLIAELSAASEDPNQTSFGSEVYRDEVGRSE